MLASEEKFCPMELISYLTRENIAAMRKLLYLTISLRYLNDRCNWHEKLVRRIYLAYILLHFLPLCIYVQCQKCSDDVKLLVQGKAMCFTSLAL
jgi:hypothetical protein